MQRTSRLGSIVPGSIAPASYAETSSRPTQIRDQIGSQVFDSARPHQTAAGWLDLLIPGPERHPWPVATPADHTQPASSRCSAKRSARDGKEAADGRRSYLWSSGAGLAPSSSRHSSAPNIHTSKAGPTDPRPCRRTHEQNTTQNNDEARALSNRKVFRRDRVQAATP
jgi:hypothetical protein